MYFGTNGADLIFIYSHQSLFLVPHVEENKKYLPFCSRDGG